MNLDFIGLFILIAGFIIGLGSVTVIDIHGFLGRKSSYWTEATIRTHKVTKPLIWLGTILAIIGGLIFYRNESLSNIPYYHALIACVLIINGIFLSFYVSPFLLKQEREGKQSELLPSSLQNKIIVSLIFSDIGWWGGLGLLVYYLINH
jgi:predicted cobalt transporter CbtA